MRTRRPSVWRFLLKNAAVWLLMVALLVTVPQELLRWCPVSVARAIGWAIAFGVWTIVVETEWRARFGVFVRFLLQLVLWVTAALLAAWVSDQINL